MYVCINVSIEANNFYCTPYIHIYILYGYICMYVCVCVWCARAAAALCSGSLCIVFIWGYATCAFGVCVSKKFEASRSSSCKIFRAQKRRSAVLVFFMRSRAIWLPSARFFFLIPKKIHISKNRELEIMEFVIRDVWKTESG